MVQGFLSQVKEVHLEGSGEPLKFLNEARM